MTKQLLGSCFEEEKRSLTSSICKMTESRSSNKMPKSQEPRKASPSLNNQHSSRKQHRKGEKPIRLALTTKQSSEYQQSQSWICKNCACRAVLSPDDTFCKRCSCCICHLFDDNKDPSLWLVCSSDADHGDYCGLSCHIECALRHEKVGVVNVGQLMQLDGSYCCTSCGKVSGILGCWKKQLLIAKDARRVDVLCYRIFLSYRLLNGTSRFKDLHEIVRDAKSKLETEVGPVDGVSEKMARGIVGRLSIAGEVQHLCSLAIKMADEWLASISNAAPNCSEDSLPAACKFLFEQVTSSSVSIILIELSYASHKSIKGYRLWYCKSREGRHQKEPTCVFPRAQRRILISNLQPCTEYTFRIVSYTEDGDLGCSEAKCFTKSVEITHKSSNSEASMNHKKKFPLVERRDSPGFKVRDIRKLQCLTRFQEQGCLKECADIERCCKMRKKMKNEAIEVQTPCIPHGLDLNVVSVPDLNEELIPPLDSSRDEDNGCSLAVEADEDSVSHDTKKNHLERSHDSTLINGSPFHVSDCSGSLDENFEYCVKMIRWLECEGHIQQEFRLKLLTWFSLKSTEQERRVVNTFIQTLIDDPTSLAGQLVHSFSDSISSRKARNGFCSSLSH